MEITVWETATFNNIPKQDNPAFYKPKRHCILIVKAQKQRCVGDKGYSVLEINGNNDCFKFDGVRSLGHFYNLENATMFAKSYKESIRRGDD